MNYEQKYKEVLQKAKEEYNRLGELGNESMKRRFEIIFPELAESEDERIRKEMIAYFEDIKEVATKSKSLDEWIAYLEKQKEQKPVDDEWLKKYNDKVNEEIGSSSYNAKDCAKPAEWRPFDKEILTKIKELIDSHFSEHEQREVYKDWLDEHISQPAKWSEEDTEMYINVASSLRGYACGLENEEHKQHIKKGLDWLENRFKSLRP